jgi:hypothetical protein
VVYSYLNGNGQELRIIIVNCKMKIIEKITESATLYILSAIFGFLGLLLGSIYSEIIPIILPPIIQQAPKTAILKLLTVAIILFVLSVALSLALYLRFRSKLFPRFGVLWDKKSEPHCPSCKNHLSNYGIYSEPGNYKGLKQGSYSGFHCIQCKENVYPIHEGKNITLDEARQIINKSS